MRNFLRIDTDNPFYQQERELRNRVLLRPIGIPDYGWEHHDKSSWHFIVLQGQKVIACVLLVPSENYKGEAQLMQMAVEKRFQGTGLGRELVNHLLKFAKERDFRRITIHSRADVTGFYEKMGFEIYGDTFVEVGVRHLHMQMLL